MLNITFNSCKIYEYIPRFLSFHAFHATKVFGKMNIEYEAEEHEEDTPAHGEPETILINKPHQH